MLVGGDTAARAKAEPLTVPAGAWTGPRYRQLLSAAGHHAVAVLVAERAPPDSWQDLCDELGVVLTWPGAFDGAVGSAEAV